MGKYLKRIGTFFTMLLMLTALWSMTAMAATDTDRNAFYVQVPADWDSPCVWAWDSDGNNAFEAWPGEEMEADPENEGWYYIWLPSFANHVIVNANDGSVQTTDISVESGKDIWLVINGPEDYTVSCGRNKGKEQSGRTHCGSSHSSCSRSRNWNCSKEEKSG